MIFKNPTSDAVVIDPYENDPENDELFSLIIPKLKKNKVSLYKRNNNILKY